MESLTKQQIVLVTILVSFITSIATGIITVALMSQAPPGVTQTVNRVVERTIEKVAPAASAGQAAAVVTTKETVVVKEDDLVVGAIDKNSKSLVNIFAVIGAGDSKQESFVGNGLVVSANGTIAADAAALAPQTDGSGNPIPQTLEAVFPDGAKIPVAEIAPPPAAAGGGAANIALLQPATATTTVFTSANLSADPLKLGQAIVAIGGHIIAVATGIVSSFGGSSAGINQQASTTPNQTGNISLIRTDISTAGKTPGSILVNLSGDVVGFHGSENADGNFLPVSAISYALDKIASSTANPTGTKPQ